MARLADMIVQLALVTGVTGLMLVPANFCLCGHEESGPAEDHQPGCPAVRQLDRHGTAVTLAADGTRLGTVPAVEVAPPAGAPRIVAAVAHGPPRRQPLYVTLQTLLI